jgi:hypothetical protein
MASSSRNPKDPQSPDVKGPDESSPPRESDDTQLKDIGQRVIDDAHEAVDSAREQLESGKRHAAEQADHLADAASDMASTLTEQDLQGLASLAKSLSDSLSVLAERLQHRNLEELIGDARELARDNPALFLFGSVAIGFGLSRFLKASEPSDDRASTDDRSRTPRGPRAAPPRSQNDTAGGLEDDLGTPGSVQFTAPDDVAASTYESVQYREGGHHE